MSPSLLGFHGVWLNFVSKNQEITRRTRTNCSEWMISKCQQISSYYHLSPGTTITGIHSSSFLGPTYIFGSYFNFRG